MEANAVLCTFLYYMGKYIYTITKMLFKFRNTTLSKQGEKTWISFTSLVTT